MSLWRIGRRFFGLGGILYQRGKKCAQSGCFSQRHGGALILFTLRGRLHVTSPCILFFHFLFVCFSFLSLFSFFSFSSLNIIGAFSFFVFLSLCFSYFIYLLSFSWLSNIIIIIYNILISFVCVRIYARTCTHDKGAVNIRHKKRSAKNSTPYYLEYIYIKCRIQCGPYARRLPRLMSRRGAALHHLSHCK